MKVRVFVGSWISSQRGDLGKIIITLSLRKYTDCSLFSIDFRDEEGKSDTWHSTQVFSTELVHN